jgi:hypothetical protein
MVAFLVSTSLPSPLAVQIKRVLNATTLIVGLPDNKIASWKPLDLSVYTVASGASISAESQAKSNMPGDDHYNAVYMADPIVADRVAMVDKYGNMNDKANPLHVTMGEGILAGILFDDIQTAYPDPTTENYKYYLSTVLVATVQVTYSDSTKAVLTRVRRI